MKRQSTQKQNVQEGGRETRRRRRVLLHRSPQVPTYTTWVGTCHTHPRAHSHLCRAPARAVPISVPVGAGPPPATSPPPAAASPVTGEGHLRASGPSGTRLRPRRPRAPSPAPRRQWREELRPQPPALLPPRLPFLSSHCRSPARRSRQRGLPGASR